MKPRFKLLWLKEGDSEGNEKFVSYLDNDWQITYSMPTEAAVCVVITKLTDVLDGLSFGVDKTAATKPKKDAN